jgi:hypothetical protein
MKGVYSKHPLASWKLLHEANRALRDRIDDTPEGVEVTWDEAMQTLAVELARPRSDAKTLLALLSDLGAIDVEDPRAEGEFYVSMATQKCQRNRSEGQMGGA